MPHTDSNHRLLYRFLPFLTWLKGYQTATLRNDALAGITVAVVLIPQSMAYAILAGMPPVYGLYAAAVTPLIGALWGSLRQLATGPIAIMSLLVLTTLTPLAEPGSKPFIELALLLALMVGILYLLIGLFRFGFIMFFISHSAVKGFTAAAALIIIATQIPHLLGLSVSRHEYIFPRLVEIVKGLPNLHIPTSIIGLVALLTIFGVQKYRKSLPAGLIALVFVTIPIVIFELHLSGVAIVGLIPKGLPHPVIPPFDFETINALLGPAVVIAMVSFAETYSVGKAISSQTKQKVNVDQEFIGQGLANIVGSFFQSYPVSGSFSRTALNYATGAKTGVSSVISSLSVVLALLFLTPLFTYIPKAALAALVISAVMLLFHPKEVFELWTMNRHDGIVAVTVFVLALLTKPDYALLIGVIVSLMFFLWKTMHPRIVRVTKDPELNMFLNADVHKKPSCPQILQLRPDNSIYFANAEYTIEHLVSRLDEQSTPVKFLLLDFQAVGFIDITGIDELRVLLDEVKARDMEITFMSVHLPVKQVFKSSGFIKELPPGCLIENRGEVITILFPQIDHVYCKETCPYALFHECHAVKQDPN
ncbi:MAG: sulfate permease [Deltaproteobacteria bacterium]|nr:sulfate permease [Deltaproteobacteria bacterium]